jgi:hypothetical protein
MSDTNPIIDRVNKATTRAELDRILYLGNYDVAAFAHLSDRDLASWLVRMVTLLIGNK